MTPPRIGELEPAVIAQGDQGYNRRMLGEVLTAVATPFAADGSVELERFRALCRHLVENGSDGVVVTGTTGEAPTLSDDERFALYEVAAGRDRLDAHGRRRNGDVRHRAFGASHRACARDRRPRLPRRDAVLQQAAAAGHRRPRRGDRGRDGSAGGVLRHPEPRRRRCRAGDDLGARGDRERPRPSSRRSRRSTRRGTSSRRASTSTPATTTSSIRSSRSGASEGSACTRTSSARR